jgi:hypothetical protein
MIKMAKAIAIKIAVKPIKPIAVKKMMAKAPPMINPAKVKKIKPIKF